MLAGCNPQGEQKTLRIGHNMALAPLDALARVNPARAAALGGRRTLAIDDPGRWRSGTPHPSSGARYQHLE
jgi:hypothetical protein